MKAPIHLLGFVLCLTVGASSGMCGSTPALFTSDLFSLTGNVLATEFGNPSTDLPVWTSAPDMLDAPLGQGDHQGPGETVPEPATFSLVALVLVMFILGPGERLRLS